MSVVENGKQCCYIVAILYLYSEPLDLFIWTNPRPQVSAGNFWVYTTLVLSFTFVCQWSRAWACHSARVRGGQDSLQESLSCYGVFLEDKTQVLRFGSRLLCLLSHLAQHSSCTPPMKREKKDSAAPTAFCLKINTIECVVGSGPKSLYFSRYLITP